VGILRWIGKLVKGDGSTEDINLDEMEPLPEDWRKFHADNVAKLDPVLRDGAVAFLADLLAHDGEIDKLRDLATASKTGDWFAAYHFHGGMWIRNKLRAAGFGEKELGIENLDDYYVGLIEIALGVVQVCP
jgi:hypothetical protein